MRWLPFCWGCDRHFAILVLCLLGLVTTKLYRRFRDGRPDGFILHAIYWVGLLPTKAKTIPNPFIRSYLP